MVDPNPWYATKTIESKVVKSEDGFGWEVIIYETLPNTDWRRLWTIHWTLTERGANRKARRLVPKYQRAEDKYAANRNAWLRKQKQVREGFPDE